ncbi:hypothetical protein ABIA23_006690 [Sinorhizobium fredii]
MVESEQRYEFSEFSGEFIDDDVTVILRIYRPADTNLDWVLEVFDEEGNTTVWENTFDIDRDASKNSSPRFSAMVYEVS